MAPAHDEDDHNHDHDRPQQDNLPMEAHERLHSGTEVDADYHHQPGPDRSRDRDAGGKDGIADLENPRGDCDRDPEARNVPAEDDGEHPVAFKPPFGSLEPLGAQVYEVGEAAFGQATTDTSRDEEQVGRPQDDDADQAEPRDDPGHEVAGDVRADVHHKHVARRGKRDPGLLRVQEAVAPEVAVPMEDEPDPVPAPVRHIR